MPLTALLATILSKLPYQIMNVQQQQNCAKERSHIYTFKVWGKSICSSGSIVAILESSIRFCDLEIVWLSKKT